MMGALVGLLKSLSDLSTVPSTVLWRFISHLPYNTEGDTMILRILLTLFLSICPALPVHAQDAAGAKDHPMLTRYPKSVIKWHDVQTFMPYKIAVGKVG